MVVIASLRSLGISSPDQKKNEKISKKTQLDEVFEKNTQMHGELEGTTHRFLGKNARFSHLGKILPICAMGKRGIATIDPGQFLGYTQLLGI